MGELQLLSGQRAYDPGVPCRNDGVRMQWRLQPGSEVPPRSISKQTNYLPEDPGNAQAWVQLRASRDKDLGNVTRMSTLNPITGNSLYMLRYERH